MNRKRARIVLLAWATARIAAIPARVSAKLAQQRNDAAHPGLCRRGSKIGERRAFADLAERRIRQDGLREGPDVQSLLDGEAPRRDQLTRLGAHNRRAENAAAPAGHNLDVALGFPLGLGAIILLFESLRARQFTLMILFAALVLLFNPLLPTFALAGNGALLLVSVLPFVASLVWINERTPRAAVPASPLG